MIKDFVWTFEVKIDEKNRFVLPSQLCKCLDKKTDELFFVLSISEEWEKYIKILDYNVFEKSANPLQIDSLKLAKQYSYSRVKLVPNHRLQLSKKEVEWLSNNWDLQKNMTCIWLVNHIAFTKKNMEELMNTLS
jgi:DNA-binding transcriptional regulator/RsmH inhibitor MraZ